MRFLVDRCAGRRLADWLREQGHDVRSATEVWPDPGDQALLEWARREERVLITIDSDFGALVFRAGEAHCGIVRLPDVPASARIALMGEALARHAEDLAAGAILTVATDRVRVSWSPWGGPVPRSN
ncbi:DUF5615 family PIN-like protein [uncultured Thiodictyon sp.]|jgi:predicted nuclease of predicted toxin-antitoxin system|uniref:DUF5615 family PIN-like protein n=1 Tax=uncultured Thiodictyon sp. TaxID=1846217 RepID=UPI0025D49C87|nr:DUF5615 family PIN-like protein [uncultured Thiodictyon sp.]